MKQKNYKEKEQEHKQGKKRYIMRRDVEHDGDVELKNFSFEDFCKELKEIEKLADAEIAKRKAEKSNGYRLMDEE